MLYVGLICAVLFVRKSKLSVLVGCGAAPLGVWCPVIQQHCFAFKVTEFSKSSFFFFSFFLSFFIEILCCLEFCFKEEWVLHLFCWLRPFLLATLKIRSRQYLSRGGGLKGANTSVADRPWVRELRKKCVWFKSF